MTPSRRRIFGFLIGVVLSPVCTIAQHRRVQRVVVSSIGPGPTIAHLVDALEQGLREQGYMVGKDVVVEVRSAEGQADRYAEVVREVASSKPDVIVTGVNASTSVVHAATRTIPIVMVIGTEVVSAGFVQSLARPGGNVTGLTWDVGPDSAAKRFELLKGLVPTMSRAAVLWEAPYGRQYRAPTDAAANALGVTTFWLEFSGDMARDFADIVRGKADAVYVHHGTGLFSRRAELAALATRHRLPTACGSAEVVDAGALMSYGPNLPDSFRQAAKYVGKILKGAKPAELPVERPTRLEFVVNRATAKTLGVTLPQPLLLRIDRLVG
jgi:putative tryptophan/tyrosine transport system substrate-binding protein